MLAEPARDRIRMDIVDLLPHLRVRVDVPVITAAALPEAVPDDAVLRHMCHVQQESRRIIPHVVEGARADELVDGV